MGRRIEGRGCKSAEVMIVSDGPGADDVKWGKLWVGLQAKVLSELLLGVGIEPKECFYSIVCQEREEVEGYEGYGQKCFWKHIAMKKKDVREEHELVDGLWVDGVLRDGRERLKREIEDVRPNIIIALGPVALWALTGRIGLEAWRGSLEQCCLVEWEMKVVGTYHPSILYSKPELRGLVELDLRRVWREKGRREFPELVERFILEPTFSQVMECLGEMRVWLEKGEVKVAYDIETRAGCVACIGLAWSGEDAICIPFMDVEKIEGYWSEEEEEEIFYFLYLVMTHRNFFGIAQNGNYDNSFMVEKWLWIPRLKRDTMVTQHAIFPTGAMTAGEEGEEVKKVADKGSFKKNLGYLSSIYRKTHKY